MSEHKVNEYCDENEKLLRRKHVEERYGICGMTINRWLHDAESQFPKPIVINSHRYWRLSELIAFERAAAAKSASKLRPPTPPHRNVKRDARDEGNARNERPHRRYR